MAAWAGVAPHQQNHPLRRAEWDFAVFATSGEGAAYMSKRKDAIGRRGFLKGAGAAGAALGGTVGTSAPGAAQPAQPAQSTAAPLRNPRRPMATFFMCSQIPFLALFRKLFLWIGNRKYAQQTVHPRRGIWPELWSWKGACAAANRPRSMRQCPHPMA